MNDRTDPAPDAAPTLEEAARVAAEQINRCWDEPDVRRLLVEHDTQIILDVFRPLFDALTRERDAAREELKILNEITHWNCECSLDDACHFARERDAARAELAIEKRRADAAEADCAELIDAFHALRNDSYGVAGLHLNGEVAPWNDLCLGGRFEEWCKAFDENHPGASLLADLAAKDAEAEKQS